jgi:hypothetical protein
VGDEDYDSN